MESIPAPAEQSPSKKKAKKRKNRHLHQQAAVIEYPVRDRIGVQPTDSLAEAGRKVLSFHFGRMLIHEPGTRLGDDIESLHDMRVATRRMRAAFKVFGTGFKKKVIKPLLGELQVTARVLGWVRDLDVFIEQLEQYQQTLPESEQAGLQPVLEAWLAQREQARQEMLVYLDSKKYERFKQDFLKFVTTEGLGAKPVSRPYQLRHLVPGLIYKRYEVVHAFEVGLDQTSPDTLHQLRIAFKQLRYTLEFFAEILGPESEMVITAVKVLQDHLGTMNDAEVTGRLMRAFLADWPQNHPHLSQTEPLDPTPVRAYLEAKQEEYQHLLETFSQLWSRFNDPRLRRNLALAISVL